MDWRMWCHGRGVEGRDGLEGAAGRWWYGDGIKCVVVGGRGWGWCPVGFPSSRCLRAKDRRLIKPPALVVAKNSPQAKRSYAAVFTGRPRTLNPQMVCRKSPTSEDTSQFRSCPLPTPNAEGQRSIPITTLAISHSLSFPDEHASRHHHVRQYPRPHNRKRRAGHASTHGDQRTIHSPL